MIPGTEISMESLLKYHRSRFYKNVHDEIFNKAGLIKAIEIMGFTNNLHLSHLEHHFKAINRLRDKFDERCKLAGKSNLLNCYDNKILEIAGMYEVPPRFKHRGVLNDIDVNLADIRHEDIRWPADYITYHCWQEGFDAELSDLGLLTMYEVGTVESFAIKRIGGFLRELYKGVAFARFINELREERYSLSGLPQIDPLATNSIRQSVMNALQPLYGNNFTGQKIMTQTEFDRLTKYTFYLVEQEDLPPNIKPISRTGISSEFIRKTFEALHTNIHGKKRRKYWFEFIHKVFSQFNDVSIDTTVKHFTYYSGSFEKDREKLLLSQVSPKSQ